MLVVEVLVDVDVVGLVVAMLVAAGGVVDSDGGAIALSEETPLASSWPTDAEQDDSTITAASAKNVGVRTP